MKRAIGVLVSWLLVAPPAVAGIKPPAGPRAPLVASDRWLNSPPLAASDLAGKVVLVEFWTFACINCIRTVPAMRALHDAFPASEVVVLSVHTPELERERRADAVARAIERLGVRYPVAIDNDFKNWRAYENRYWPALYLVDRRGVIRATHIGELHQGTAAWRALLATIEALRREPAGLSRHGPAVSRDRGAS